MERSSLASCDCCCSSSSSRWLSFSLHIKSLCSSSLCFNHLTHVIDNGCSCNCGFSSRFIQLGCRGFKGEMLGTLPARFSKSLVTIRPEGQLSTWEYLAGEVLEQEGREMNNGVVAYTDIARVASNEKYRLEQLQQKNDEGRQSAVEILREGLQDAQGGLDRGITVSLLQGNRVLSRGKSIHSFIIKSGRGNDIFLMNHVIIMYGKCGASEYARSVFDNMHERNLVSWNVMIAAYAQNDCRNETFDLFKQMQRAGVKPNNVTFLNTLRACDNPASLPDGKLVHLHIIDCGLELDPVLGTALVDMYGKCQALQEAEVVFERMNHRDVVSWNAMISTFAQQGDGKKALQLFGKMQTQCVQPGKITFISVLRACDCVADLAEGQAIHASVVKSGLESDAIVGTALVNMYGKCGAIDDVNSVFDKIHQHDVVSWTALITAYAQQGHGEDALRCFQQMQVEGVKPNEFTLVGVLCACASLASLEEGKIAHISVIDSGFESNFIVGTALIKMYGSCGDLENACVMFERMHTRNVVSWAAMIDAHVQKGHAKRALGLFWQMQSEQVRPDAFVCVSALSACGSLAALKEGEIIHNCIVDGGFELNPLVQTALVKMYGDCGAVDKAQAVFDQLHQQDLISWNTMITVYAQHGYDKEALQVFQQMKSEGITPSSISFINVLCACAGLAGLLEAKNIHRSIVESGFESDLLMGNALINMYGRCGALDDARSVFDRMYQRSVMTWTSMITAYAQQGHGRNAVQLFESMQHEGVKPDEIAFVSVLSACSHAGLIDEGLQCFGSMIGEHGIIPMSEHYKCMIDLFGRSGRLHEAEDFICKMHIQPDMIVWMTFLGACRIHGDLERGKWAAERVMELDPENSAPYVLLANICVLEDDIESLGKL